MFRVIDPTNAESVQVKVAYDLEVGRHTFEIERDDERKLRLDVIYSVIEPEPLYRDADWLHRAYVEERRTMANIASEFGVSAMTIHGWIKKHGIPSRPRGRMIE